MEEKFWKQFMVSGKVSDYLYYRGFGILRQIMAKYGELPVEDRIIGAGKSYGDGDLSSPDR